MREKAAFLDEVRQMAPDVANPERLWEALRAASQETGDEAWTERSQEILAELMEEPQKSASIVSSLWREFTLVPMGSLALTAGLTLAVLVLELLAPPLIVRGHALAWIGLGAPWLGVLWGLTVAPTRQGAWSDWRAMAPLRFELLMVARLGAVALVSLIVAAVLSLTGVPAGTAAWALALSWAGPFALGAVLMVALTSRWSATAALAVSAVAWGTPLTIGLASSGRLLGAGSALIGYILVRADESMLLPDAAMLVGACTLAIWLTRRGASWILN